MFGGSGLMLNARPITDLGVVRGVAGARALSILIAS